MKKFAILVLLILVCVVPSVDAYPKAVLFTFDDMWRSVYTKAYPILDSAGFNGTFYVFTDGVDTANTTNRAIRLSDIDDLYNSGWDIASHTTTHPDLSTLNLSEQTNELQRSADKLDSWGFTRSSHHLAFPYGKYNDDTETAMRTVGIFTGRTVHSENLEVPHSDVYHLPGVRMLDNRTLWTESTFLQEKNSTDVVIYLIHGVDDEPYGYVNSTDLQQLVDYISTNNITVLTISEFYSLNANEASPRPMWISIRHLFEYFKERFISR